MSYQLYMLSVLITYCYSQGIWGSLPRPRASASSQGLDWEGSSEFMPGSLSSVAEDDVWAASHMGTMRSTKSLGGTMPVGSSPERVRIIQEDYHATGR